MCKKINMNKEVDKAVSDIENAFGAKVYQKEDNKTYLSVRDWGNWENPEDADDEEDYDYQELDDKSYKEFQKKLNILKKNNPKVDVDGEQEEKRYLDFTVSKKNHRQQD